MPTIIRDAQNFILGASKSDFFSNAGYSPEDKGVNIEAIEGLLCPPPALTNRGSVGGTICAWGLSEGALGTALVGVNDEGGFYTFSSLGVPTLKVTDTSGNSYSDMKTDIVFYNGDFYITSTTNIIKASWNFGTFDYSWWVATSGKTALSSVVAHQLLVFNNKLYVIDEETIYTYDSSTFTTFNSVVESTDKITAFCVFQNKIYIATEPYYNASGSYHGKGKMYVWDGVSTYPEYSYPINERVDTFFAHNGSLYAFTNKSFGRWNGSEFSPLYELNSNVYKQQITERNNKIYFVDNHQGTLGLFTAKVHNQYSVCCYDTVTGRISHPIQYIDTTTGYEYLKPIDGIVSYSGDKINIASVDTLFSTEVTNISGYGYFRDNRINFGKNVKIKHVTVELSEELSSAEMVFSFYDHLKASKSIGTMTSGIIKEFKNINIDTYSMQLRVYFKTNAKPIKSITIEYEPTEQPTRLA